MAEKCKWELLDIDTADYSTDCNNIHQFMDGGPKENHYKYCPFCGKEIEIDG